MQLKLKALVLLLTESQSEELPEYKHVEFVTMIKPSMEEVARALVEHRFGVMLSFGEYAQWSYLSKQPLSVRMLWSHFASLRELPTERDLLYRYVKGALDHPLESDHPLISVITTTFHSGRRIDRPWQSLLGQSYDRWEWIVCDDSLDQETYAELQTMAATDARVRVYKAPRHSGYIGEMKQMAAGLARGTWIVELDHDDIISPQLFANLVDINNRIPQAVFVYSDFVELYEHTEHPFAYPEGYALGYGSYAKQHVRGRYHYVAQSPPINPVTLSHIVGVPNHVRIWRADVYHRVRKHKHQLPVVDDYELILNTFVQTDFATETWVRIVSPLYFQYRNEGGSNFTFIRNDLIQRLVPIVHSLYASRLRQAYARLAWRCDKDAYAPIETCYVPEDRIPHRPCVSVIVAVGNQTEEALSQKIASLLGQSYENWIAFIIGSQCSFLDAHMETYADARLRYFNLTSSGPESNPPIEAYQYAMRMLVKTRYCTMYHDDDPVWTMHHLCDVVANVAQ